MSPYESVVASGLTIVVGAYRGFGQIWEGRGLDYWLSGFNMWSFDGQN